jgi:predicted RNase H-like HicB family nuclease
MTAYIAMIHKDPDSDYGVSFPDFPGCVTAGSTLEEARDMADEALGAHVGYLRETGRAVPEPTTLDAIMADPETAGAVSFLVVSVPEARQKPVRINVMIPDADLRRIDATARRLGMSRSSLLVRAARKFLLAGSGPPSPADTP